MHTLDLVNAYFRACHFVKVILANNCQLKICHLRYTYNFVLSVAYVTINDISLFYKWTSIILQGPGPLYNIFSIVSEHINTALVL